MRKEKNLSELLSHSEISKKNAIECRLSELKQQFNILNTLSNVLGEVVWTRLFRFILDSSESHFLGSAPFLFWIKELAKKEPGIKKFYNSYLDTQLCKIIATPEWTTPKGRRVDILLELLGKSNHPIAIIGIENKLYSLESDAQVQDYQNALIETFPKIPKLMIYCTPDGKDSLTAKEIKSCPHFCISYSSFFAVCEHFRSVAKGELSVMLNAFSRYMESILLESELRSLNAKAINQLSNPSQIVKYSSAITFFNKFEQIVKNQRFPFTDFDVKPFATNKFEVFLNGLSNYCYNYYLVPCYVITTVKNPKIGDSVVVRVTIWYDGVEQVPAKHRDNIREEIIRVFKLNGNVGGTKSWDRHINIWTSKRYNLTDLGAHDLDNLTELLNDSVRSTYNQLEELISSCFAGNKCKLIFDQLVDRYEKAGVPVIEFCNMVILKQDKSSMDCTVEVDMKLGKFSGHGKLTSNPNKEFIGGTSEPTNKLFWDSLKHDKKLSKLTWEKYSRLFFEAFDKALIKYLAR